MPNDAPREGMKREQLADKLGVILGQSVDPGKVHDCLMALYDALRDSAGGEGKMCPKCGVQMVEIVGEGGKFYCPPCCASRQPARGDGCPDCGTSECVNGNPAIADPKITRSGGAEGELRMAMPEVQRSRAR